MHAFAPSHSTCHSQLAYRGRLHLCDCRPGKPWKATASSRMHAPRMALETDMKIDPASTDRLLKTLESTVFPPNRALIEDMVMHLGDSRGLARLALVDNFGRIGSAAVPVLLRALATSPNPVVRRSSGKALAKIGDSSATEALLHALVHDDDTVTRSSAAGALARMGATAVPALLKLIADPNANMTAKGHAAWAVAFMQGDAAAELFDQLASDNDDVRVAVVNALGAVAIGDALPAMSGTSVDDWDSASDNTADNSKEVRKRAIACLSTALDDRSGEVRAEAATALANAVCVQEAPRIAKLLNDEDPETRRCAALSLMKLGDTSFISLLDAKSNDESEPDSVRSVAKLAVNALKRQEVDENDDWD